MAKLGAARLQSTLQAVARLEHGGGPRERAALMVGLDDWLPTQVPIHGLGPDMPTSGFPLATTAEGRLWLVPGGRLLTIPDDPDEPARIAPLSDVELDPALLCPPLKAAVITSYVGGVPLAELSGPTVPVVVADLLQLTWDLDADGRATVLAALAGAMRPAEGWDQAAVRLKAGFERGVSDRAAAVRGVAARALVWMAAGAGPAMPMADPSKILTVLFTVPYTDVHVATLGALTQLEPAVLAKMLPVLAPRLKQAATDPNPETRRLAGVLELRLVGRPEADHLAEDLGDPDPLRRADALRQVASLPESVRSAFLPHLLERAADPAPEVREAALAALRPLLDEEDAAARARILTTLLGSRDARLGRAALDYLSTHPVQDLEVDRALRLALDGPEQNRALAATLFCDSFERADDEDAVEGYILLLRHKDPVVRQAALRQLVAQPPRRSTVREELLVALQEHLRDPEPSLRLEAARAIVGLGYPRAPELVAQLALDPDAVARRGVLAVLREAGDRAVLAQAERLVGQADTLRELPRPGDGDARVRWMGALEAISQEPGPRATELLVAVLASIPPDTVDPFLRQAIVELDGRILERAVDGEALLQVCHRLLEPPWPQPEHASRLAGAAAASSPLALDLLWTMFTAAGGTTSEAARRALAELATAPKSPAVTQALHSLMAETEDPALRDVLRTVAGEAPAAGR